MRAEAGVAIGIPVRPGLGAVGRRCAEGGGSQGWEILVSLSMGCEILGGVAVAGMERAIGFLVDISNLG